MIDTNTGDNFTLFDLDDLNFKDIGLDLDDVDFEPLEMALDDLDLNFDLSGLDLDFNIDGLMSDQDFDIPTLDTSDFDSLEL